MLKEKVKAALNEAMDRALENGWDFEDEGLCLACGEPAYGVEPDAREYECESCGACKVYGMPELLMSAMC